MLRYFSLLFLFAVSPTTSSAAPPASQPVLSLPPNISLILDHIYSGRSDLAILEARELQRQYADLPLGYILEDEVLWWKIWCTSAEFKYGMTLPRHREKLAADQHYLDIATKAYALAEANLAKKDTAEMRLYAGMADALSARLYGLRGEARATARSGVRARSNFLRALAIDPSLADADLGLGLYNYYVDTLSTFARVLRFFMGIPGGSKEEGIRQLRRAIQEGQLSPATARFYLALNLHNYDRRYGEALQILSPLAKQYPDNPLFQLAQGDLYAKLGNRELALFSYRAASTVLVKVVDTECRTRVAALVRESLKSLGSTP